MNIHSTAIVHPKAVLGEGTRVGAYSIIDEGAVLGKDCEVQEHVVIRGGTIIGDEVKIFPFAALGGEPQHTKYSGEPTTAEIGSGCVIRESVTIHRGTPFGGGITRVGRKTFLMAYTHVAHDCIVGSNVILANNVQLAGHVEVHDNAIVGGQSAIAQFCRVGKYAYIGGGSILRKDFPPFLTGKGGDMEVQGVNAVGLNRQGFSDQTIKRLRNVYKIFFLQGLTVNQAVEKILLDLGDGDEVKVFLDFVRGSKVGITR